MMTPPLSDGERTHGDFDGGPTKRWFAEIQGDRQYASYVDLAWGKRPEEELYDLQSDPDQMQNLVDSPKHADVRNTLSTQLMQVLKDSGDPRVVGDGDAFDKSPYLSVRSPSKKKRP